MTEEQKQYSDSKSRLTEQIDDLIEDFTISRSTDLISIIFTVSNDLLMLVTTEGKILRVNSEWEDTIGYTTEEMRGKNIFDFVHPDDVEHTKKALGEVIKTQKALSHFENRYITKDGGSVNLVWTSDKNSPVINGAVIGKARVK